MRKAIWLILAVLGLTFAVAMTSCRQSEVKRVEAKLWKIDAEDATVYRVIKKPDGQEVEQFYYVQGNPDKMKEFACMLADDRKQLFDAWSRCGCSL